jgi:arsenate reductase-like glutaredoxin family protein
MINQKIDQIDLRYESNTSTNLNQISSADSDSTKFLIENNQKLMKELINAQRDHIKRESEINDRHEHNLVIVQLHSILNIIYNFWI